MSYTITEQAAGMGARHRAGRIRSLRRAAALAMLAADEATEALLSVPPAGELAAWRAQYTALLQRDEALRALRRAQNV